MRLLVRDDLEEELENVPPSTGALLLRSVQPTDVLHGWYSEWQMEREDKPVGE